MLRFRGALHNTQLKQMGSIHIHPLHRCSVVPAHKQLHAGTLNAVVRSVAQHKRVQREDIIQTL